MRGKCCPRNKGTAAEDLKERFEGRWGVQLDLEEGQERAQRPAYARARRPCWPLIGRFCGAARFTGEGGSRSVGQSTWRACDHSDTCPGPQPLCLLVGESELRGWGVRWRQLCLPWGGLSGIQARTLAQVGVASGREVICRTGPGGLRLWHPCSHFRCPKTAAFSGIFHTLHVW